MSHINHTFCFGGPKSWCVPEGRENNTASVESLPTLKQILENLIPRDFPMIFFLSCYPTDLFVVSADIVYLHSVQELFQ